MEAQTIALVIVGLVGALLINLAAVLGYAAFDLSRSIIEESKLQHRKRRFKKAKRAHTLQTLTESMKESAF